MVLKDFNQNGFLMPPYPLTNFEIQRYYQNKHRINGVYLRDNLPNKIKNWTYITNLDEYADAGSHSIALYELDNDAIDFESFDVEHTPRDIRCFIGNKNMQTNIFRIQAYETVM